MRRLFALLLVVAMLAAGFAAAPKAVTAQEAPTGVFLGTWPYKLPPDHHFNGFVAAGGPSDNLGVVFRQMVEMPLGYFIWAEGRYEGLLAEKFGFTEDNKAYSVTLKDAKWSDGSPVTADDVVGTYALGRLLGWSDWNYITDVVKVDDKTVNFVFKAAPSLLAERLFLKTNIRAAATFAEFIPQAQELFAAGKTKDDQEWKDLLAKLNEFRPAQLLATGPYTYTMDDVSDSYMTLKWQPNSVYSGMVKFGEIRLWAGETDATTPLVLSGDIAFSTNVYPPATQQAIRDAGIRLIIQPRMYGPALLFQHDVYPFNIKEVRQAAAYAINREESAFLTNGLGTTATVYMAGLLDSSVPVLMNQEDIDKLNRYENNLDKAAEMMTTAGFTKNADGKWVDKDGKTVKAEYKFPAEFADFSGAAQNAIDQLNKFGWDITGRALPWQQTAEDIRNGAFELSVWSWASGSPFATTQFFGPIQRFNYVGLAEGQKGMNFQMKFNYNGEDLDLDAMIKEASAGLDAAEQRARAGKIALILNDLMPFVPLNIILSTEPWNETLIAGAPADGDPIYQNPSADHFAVWYLLNGLISPVAK